MFSRHWFAKAISTTALCGVVLAGGSALAPASVAAPLTVASLTAHDAIVGTWVGTFSGFESGKASKGLERFVITKAKASAAKGTWSFRTTASDPWSAPSPLQFVVLPTADGSWQATGADVNGIYIGSMNAAGTTMDLTYQGSVNELIALHFVMKKK